LHIHADWGCSGSDNTVKINGQNFTSTGLKLTGNLQQQIANLKEQVKTYYEINK